jgi:hypothetical protein
MLKLIGILLIIGASSSHKLFAQADFERPQNYRVRKELVNPYDRLPAPKPQITNPQEPAFKKPFIEKQYSTELNKLITLHQNLLNKQKEQDGFRIQIVSTTDQNVIKKARIDFSELNTTLKLYQVYDRPYYKLRVGDFLTKFEAEQMVYVLLKTFPAAFVVPDKVKVY